MRPALAAFLRSCARLDNRNDSEPLSPRARWAGQVGDWRAACTAATMTGPTAEAARAARVSPLGSPSEAIAHADWIVSAVTASSSLAAGQSVAPAIAAGQIFIDINSVSPGRKQETAALLVSKGAAYVDMAVMAPVHPRGHRTPACPLYTSPSPRDRTRTRMPALA